MTTSRYAFPLIKFGRDSADAIGIREVCGTAFPISPGVFMTAAHVMSYAFKDGYAAIGIHENGMLATRAVVEFELFDHADAAIFRAEVADAAKLLWVLRDCEMLHQVNVTGFPHAFDAVRRRVVARSFLGHVVADSIHPTIPREPGCYELSFACPRGLSGAALFAWAPGVKVAGMIQGNATAEIQVFAEREVMDDGTTTIVEKYEAMHLGIAIKAKELAKLESRLLGEDVKSHLQRNGRIATLS